MAFKLTLRLACPDHSGNDRPDGDPDAQFEVLQGVLVESLQFLEHFDCEIHHCDHDRSVVILFVDEQWLKINEREVQTH